MIGELSKVLDRVEAALGDLNRGILLKLMRLGISADTVRAQLAEVGLESTRDLEIFYGWRNGIAEAPDAKIGEIAIFPGFYLLSLDEAISNYRTFVGDPRWKAGWLPLLEDGGGDFYVIDLRAADKQPIRRFRIVEVEHPVEYLSLGSFVGTLCAAYERGVFFTNDRGYLDMDYFAFNNFAAELNPTVEWWQV